MATYTEENFTDQVTVNVDTGLVFWRDVTVVYKDGVEWKREISRRSCHLDERVPADIPHEVLPYITLADTPAARAKWAKIKEDSLALAEKGAPKK